MLDEWPAALLPLLPGPSAPTVTDEGSGVEWAFTATPHGDHVRLVLRAINHQPYDDLLFVLISAAAGDGWPIHWWTSRVTLDLNVTLMRCYVRGVTNTFAEIVWLPEGEALDHIVGVRNLPRGKAGDRAFQRLRVGADVLENILTDRTPKGRPRGAWTPNVGELEAKVMALRRSYRLTKPLLAKHFAVSEATLTRYLAAADIDWIDIRAGRWP
ncbi:MAG: hypothetical protein AB7R89_28810 [Dehalococcoidia bacterium]